MELCRVYSDDSGVELGLLGFMLGFGFFWMVMEPSGSRSPFFKIFGRLGFLSVPLVCSSVCDFVFDCDVGVIEARRAHYARPRRVHGLFARANKENAKKGKAEKKYGDKNTET